MTTTALYRTPSERARAVAAAQAEGRSTLHDDFNVGPNGENRLTFVVKTPDPVSAGKRAALDRLTAYLGAAPSTPDKAAIQDLAILLGLVPPL